MGSGLGGSLRMGVAALSAVAPDHVAATPPLARAAASEHANWLVYEPIGVVLGGLVAAYTAGRLKKDVLKGPRISTGGRLAFALAGGAALGVYTGVLLSTLGARALWSSALLGPLFLVSGVSTGAALLLLFRVSDEERHLIGTWDRLAIALELAILALFLAGLRASGAGAMAAAGLLLGGGFTAPFWALVVIGGLAVPLLLATLEARLRLPTTLAAPLLVLAGGLALRWILVAAGQA